ncbi:hypothetical protein A2165_03940 [Candidatus Curtissbacteria bacterium RBG_13_40_7]|uniref:DDH domain-containing protein n=1 Tax=Candidatus Curtissbacteria bacterium RBG_13_40_7 TaxID=1797706 RepID=A0A1F5FTS4_9BACT|nr:MAG: hypothetical protein A2165_03940 [Candidatus Curtissbacteria bacterium RBG_13_40_7]
MDENLKQGTLEKLTKAQAILVAVSPASGFDGLACGLALYLSLSKLGKNVAILAKPPTVSDAMKLYSVDKVGGANQSNNMVIVVKDAVTSVDKVTYFLDGDRLKIVLHSLAGSQGVIKDQISFEQAPPKADLIFTIGFSSKEELKNEFIHEQLFDSTVWIVNIAKSILEQKFAQANFSNPEATSFSEICAQLIQQLALPLNEDIAYNLYAGIAYATENFSISKSSPVSFEIASWLVKFGAARASFAREIAKPVQESKIQPQSQIQPDYYTPSTPYEAPPIEEVEKEKKSQEDWLKPPKIYKGSKSFDSEY